MADKNRDRRRDAAGIGPYAGDAERLVRLADMGKWNVADGEPDIRHWEVRTIGGRELGKVRELLIDPDAGEVVMLEVDLTGSDRNALVPLRNVEIDRNSRVVRMDSADLASADQGESSTSTTAPISGAGAVTSRERTWAESGRVRYPGREGERVVERQPMVEEVVVRRRVVEPGEDRVEKGSRADAAADEERRAEDRD